MAARWKFLISAVSLSILSLTGSAASATSTSPAPVLLSFQGDNLQGCYDFRCKECGGFNGGSCDRYLCPDCFKKEQEKERKRIEEQRRQNPPR